MDTSYNDALARFLADKERKQADFAAAIGTTQAAVNRYAKGRRFPKAETARAIDTATGGEVPFALWQEIASKRLGIAA